jgi:hypothetical protein
MAEKALFQMKMGRRRISKLVKTTGVSSLLLAPMQLPRMAHLAITVSIKTMFVY